VILAVKKETNRILQKSLYIIYLLYNNNNVIEVQENVYMTNVSKNLKIYLKRYQRYVYVCVYAYKLNKINIF